MRFDYSREMAKYDGVNSIVAAAGYAVANFARFEAGDATGFSAPGTFRDSATLLVYSRRRGWFVRPPGPNTYRVGKEEWIADVCIEILARWHDNPSLPALDESLIAQYDLQIVPLHKWAEEEWEDQRLAWGRKGWREIPQAEEDFVWARFHGTFGMKANHDPGKSSTWDIEWVFSNDESTVDYLEADLTIKTLAAFRECVAAGNAILALSWNHPCYYFEPHAGSYEVTRNAWAIPLLPNGEDYYFLAQDFQFGFLGRYILRNICVFGQTLIDAYSLRMPTVFQNLIRVDGQRP